MGTQLKRNRDANGDIAVLDLSDGDAADRRFEVSNADGLGRSSRFFQFAWTKSTSQAVNVTVSLIDTADSNREYVIEGPVSDGGATSGYWAPPEGVELLTGMEVGRPNAGTLTWRLQFSQAGGACNANAFAVYKEV